MKAVSTDNGTTWQMFDLARDIGEQDDLAVANSDKLKLLINKHQLWESGLMPQQWGWNKTLGYKDLEFGKPQPYHAPNYFKKTQLPQSGSAK